MPTPLTSRVMMSKRVKPIAKRGKLSELLHEVNTFARAMPTVRDAQVKLLVGTASEAVAAQLKPGTHDIWIAWVDEDIVVENNVKTPAPNVVQFTDFSAKDPDLLAQRVNEFAIKHEVSKVTVLWAVDGWTAVVRYGVYISN